MSSDIAVALIAAGASLLPTIIGLINRRKIQEVHVMMNSRFSEMMRLAVVAAEARGVLVGKGEREKGDTT